VGELPMIPAPAAVVNALEDATGVRLTTLPLTPERAALGIVANEGNGHP
jgi:CO/xanthine dehydrogenase Mo-binding subunit